VYKGVVINYEATIQQVTERLVKLQVARAQAVALLFERQTRIEIPGIAGAFEAFVHDLDVPTETAWLRDFRVSATAMLRRVETRVEPKDPIEVEVQTSRIKLLTQLGDVSGSGLGLAIARIYATPTVFRSGDDIEARLMGLPNSRNPIVVRGKIIYVRNELDQGRLGIGGVTSLLNTPAIRDYIALRQTEILREMNGLFQAEVQKRLRG
jgi:hypothetical protein